MPGSTHPFPLASLFSCSSENIIHITVKWPVITNVQTALLLHRGVYCTNQALARVGIRDGTGETWSAESSSLRARPKYAFILHRQRSCSRHEFLYIEYISWQSFNGASALETPLRCRHLEIISTALLILILALTLAAAVDCSLYADGTGPKRA